MNGTKGLMVAAAAVLLVAGCVTPGKRTATGAAGGAVIGAGVGGAAGGGKGAVIGGAVGAAAGGAIGNILDKQARELEKVAETKRTKDAVLVNLKSDVLFDFNSAQVRDEAIANLNEVGDILAKYPQDRIRVEGHTDALGSDDYNKKLSLRRADTVRDILMSRGVREDQIQIVGFGEERPVAPNDDATGRAQNRRVQLQITIPHAEPKQRA